MVALWSFQDQICDHVGREISDTRLSAALASTYFVRGLGRIKRAFP
jgi:hypothetical protein